MNEEERRREIIVLGYLAALISLVAFFYFFRQNQVPLYGDAVAHMNIARRVFDSRTPGLKQLGTVWLPLPHLLMIPFVVNDWAWRTGFGASWPFMASYVAGVVGIFRLVRDGLAGLPGGKPRLTAHFAAAIYGLNPNLIYVQATAMTESLYLALFIWAVVFFGDFVRQTCADATPTASAKAGRSLRRCGICLAGAMLTRYDGWFLAACIAVLVAIWMITRRRAQPHIGWALRKPLVTFAALVFAVPAFWLTYNAVVYGDALDFARGPYSAHGIEQRTRKAGDPHHPGYNSLTVAELYFLKSAQLNLGETHWQKPWLLLAASGVVVLLVFFRQLSPWLLLLLPLPFYALSIAHGGVPIFLPVWWPFSYYNARYGLQLLPAIAVFSAVALQWAEAGLLQRRWRIGTAAMVFAFVIVSYIFVWRAQPICLREAIANSRTRITFERALAFQ